MTSTVAIVGNVNVDLIICPVDELPPPGTERIVDRVEMRVGGAAATTALALARLGSPSRVASYIGDDELGRWLQRALAQGGVGSEIQAIAGTTTGVSMAFEAPGRDRSFLTDLGGLRGIDASAVPKEALTCELVLFCGYFLLPALRGAPTATLMGRVHAAGGRVLLDTGWDPEGWTAPTRTEITAILPSVDVFLPNELEVRAIAEVDETTSAARALQAISKGWVVVKCGAAGCVAVGPDGRELAASAPSIEVTDTVGAGDAFNAGLVYGLSEGEEIADALDVAVRLGSAIVSRPSADRYPDASEFLAL